MVALWMQYACLAAVQVAGVATPVAPVPEAAPVAVVDASDPVLLADIAPMRIEMAKDEPTPPQVPPPKNAKPKVETPAAPPKAASPAEELARKVQSFYETTKDFTASFTQTMKTKGMRKEQVQAGTVAVKKPGLMRWDYASPDAKQFVADGKAFWFHVADSNVVQVNRRYSDDQLSAAVTFLFGRGKLTDEFDVAITTDPKEAGPGETVLELTPKKAQGSFKKLFFKVDPATGAVQRSVIVDPTGGRNRIDFKDMKTNVGLDAKHFAFEVPKGKTVQELP